MNILISECFFDTIINNEPLLKDKSLRIFTNGNNKFVISKKYIEFFENYYRDNEHFPIIQSFLKQLIDRKVKEYQTDTLQSNNLPEEISNLLNLYSLTDPIIVCTKNSITSKPDIKNFEFSYSNEPNSHWQKILYELLSISIVRINYYDVKNDNEIKEIFTSIQGIFKNLNTIFIYDRELNFTTNTNINSFLDVKNKIIYTKGWGHDPGYTNLKSAKQEIERKFKGRVRIYITKKKEILHERRILINSLIIDSNQDLGAIVSSDKTWTVTICKNLKESESFRLKNPEFSELK